MKKERTDKIIEYILEYSNFVYILVRSVSDKLSATYTILYDGLRKRYEKKRVDKKLFLIVVDEYGRKINRSFFVT